MRVALIVIQSLLKSAKYKETNDDNLGTNVFISSNHFTINKFSSNFYRNYEQNICILAIVIQILKQFHFRENRVKNILVVVNLEGFRLKCSLCYFPELGVHRLA